jgi:hypothetical protein
MQIALQIRSKTRKALHLNADFIADLIRKHIAESLKIVPDVASSSSSSRRKHTDGDKYT